MRIRRTLPIWVGLLIFVAAVTIVVQLRKHAPPEPARLLPGADGFLYVNLKWMRRAEMANRLPPVPHDPEYERFIQATGFQFERDLEEAAFAIHYASPATDGERRFSEIFVAHIDSEKLRAYLKTLASSIDTYRVIDIYNIPVENRSCGSRFLGWTRSPHPTTTTRLSFVASSIARANWHRLLADRPCCASSINTFRNCRCPAWDGQFSRSTPIWLQLRSRVRSLWSPRFVISAQFTFAPRHSPRTKRLPTNSLPRRARF